MGGKIDSWNWVGTTYGTESAMFHKMLIFKAGIDFVLESSFLTSRESIPRRNLFSQEIDYVESMPGVHKSLKIRAHMALPLVKAESIEWFIEDQVFSPSCEPERRHTGSENEIQLADGREGQGAREEPNQTTVEMPGLL
jgi:hypothetical protein